MDNAALTFIVFLLVGVLGGFFATMLGVWFRLQKWAINQQRQIDDLKRELEEIKRNQ